jgi:hypothetical protein
METLYKTKNPEASAWVEQYFELTMEEETVDGRVGYFVRETHCWWDAAAKRTVRVQYTLSPRGGFATVEEAHERYKLQRTTRAQRGFVHSFVPRYETTKRHKYKRIDVSAGNNQRGAPASAD